MDNDDKGQAIFQKILDADNKIDVVNYTLDLARHNLELAGHVAAGNHLSTLKIVNADKPEGKTHDRVTEKTGHA